MTEMPPVNEVLDWNLRQMRIILKWEDLQELEHLSSEELAHLWAPKFGPVARELKNFGIAGSTIEARMVDIEGSSTRHIENLKTFMSEDQSHDVGLRETLEAIDVKLTPVNDGDYRIGVEVALFYPSVNGVDNGYAEKFMLPIYGRPLPAPTEEAPGSPLVPIQLQTQQQVNDLLSA